VAVCSIVSNPRARGGRPGAESVPGIVARFAKRSGRVAGPTASLREEWEATGFHLERLQCAVECVEEEQAGQSGRQTPQWNVPYQPRYIPKP